MNLEDIPGTKPTLLEKLLASEVRRERNVLLQCIRHIVDTGFLGRYKTEQGGSTGVEGEGRTVREEGTSGVGAVEEKETSGVEGEGTSGVEGEVMAVLETTCVEKETSWVGGEVNAVKGKGVEGETSKMVVFKQEPLS